MIVKPMRPVLENHLFIPEHVAESIFDFDSETSPISDYLHKVFKSLGNLFHVDPVQQKAPNFNK